MKIETWRQYPPRPCVVFANILLRLSAAGCVFCSYISSKMLAVFCYKQLVQFKSGSPQENPPALLLSWIQSFFNFKLKIVRKFALTLFSSANLFTLASPTIYWLVISPEKVISILGHRFFILQYTNFWVLTWNCKSVFAKILTAHTYRNQLSPNL